MALNTDLVKVMIYLRYIALYPFICLLFCLNASKQAVGQPMNDGNTTVNSAFVSVAAINRTATDVPLAIPDDISTGVVSTISVNENASVTAAEVELQITHPYIGDLVVQLVCPSGEWVTLHNRTGRNTDNIDQDYAISSCNGQSSQGVWQLKVIDNAWWDVGTLDRWSLRLTLQPTGNRTPVANVGADQQVSSNQTVILDGSQSSDPDGDPISYRWIQVEGPPVQLNGPYSDKPNFAAPHVQENTALAFQLTVSDGQTVSQPAVIKITVMATAQNPSTLASTDTPVDIPDAQSSGIVSVIPVTSVGEFSNLEVEVHIRHTYKSDLEVALECPDGQVIRLHNREGGSGDDIDTTYRIPECNRLQMSGNWRLHVIDYERYDIGTLLNWSLKFAVTDPLQANTRINGIKDWYLIGNALTRGNDEIHLQVQSDASIENLNLAIDGLFIRQLALSNGSFNGSIDISNLVPGEHILELSTNDNRMAARKTFRRSHPYYVLLTTDWDSSDSEDYVLQLHEALHREHPYLKITHFLGPYTFTDPLVSSVRRAFIANWLLGLMSSQSDEIGLHIHPYCNFVDTVVCVDCKFKPSYIYMDGDETGYTVLSSAYSENDYLKLLQASDRLFARYGLAKPTAFRAGGWVANSDILRALSADGFVADLSANNWVKLDEMQAYRNGVLYDWNRRNWAPIGDRSQPYTPYELNPAVSGSPSIPILEIPDNASLVDYVTLDEMIAIFQANWNGPPLSRPLTLHSAFIR